MFPPVEPPCGSKVADGMARGAIIGVAWGAVIDIFGSPVRPADAHVPDAKAGLLDVAKKTPAADAFSRDSLRQGLLSARTGITRAARRGNA